MGSATNVYTLKLVYIYDALLFDKNIVKITFCVKIVLCLEVMSQGP